MTACAPSSPDVDVTAGAPTPASAIAFDATVAFSVPQPITVFAQPIEHGSPPTNRRLAALSILLI